MNAQQLKNAILQEAIEGRLVPQDPNDEPASVLLDRIRKEKVQLVKEGKLKKKDLEEIPITEDEKPFEIPKGWEWVRLSTYLDIRDGTHDSPKYVADGIPFVTSKNLSDGKIDFSTCKYISIEDHEKFSVRSFVEDGDILFAMIGSIGNPVIVKKNREFSIKNVALFKRYAKHLTNEKYLFYYFTFIQYEFKKIASGGVQSFLGLSFFRNWVIPLPPLAEQQRIVARIEELLPKVEEYGKAQEALDRLNAELPERLKKSILQEAIEGRLVPQDPNDEPASALLDRIRKEKAQLAKEGKLKKKDLEETPIAEDGKPFEIPESWSFVKLSFITSLLDGEKIEGSHVCLDAKYLRGKSTGDLVNKGRFVKKGDNIILVDGENSGEVFTVPCDGYMGSTFKQLWVSESIYLPYVLFFIKFYKNILRNSKKGAAIPHLNKDVFNNLAVGIPHFAEQQRIVAKIEELLGAINALP